MAALVRTQPARLVATLAVVLFAVAAPRRALGWATAEHVRFGQQIAAPFEERSQGDRLPVMTVDDGPQTFGHWVSAPDSARGLLGFLAADPVLGATACSVLWNPEGVVDGEVIDDQSASVFDSLGYLDCLDTYRMNNSHFGDFAAFHYAHYHALAVEAARRYWRNRQPVCQQAAYTLEGWGQHYLTDATAIGHAWNPAGTYDSGFDWQTTSSITQRMRIHNALNASGGRLDGALYDLGVVWGDHSEEHLAASVPELIDDPQRALTLHLTRMSLGQVVMAAECGGPVDVADVFGGGDPLDDPRRMYVSDASMCDVMYGDDIGTWQPDWWEDLGVDMANVQDVVDLCRDGGGVLPGGRRDGAVLARHWFQDKYYEVSPVDGWVSATIDPEAVLAVDDLGCTDDLPVLPVAEGERDACGMTRCATPPDDAGACPTGTVLEAACCLAAPSDLGDARGKVTATPWRSAAILPQVDLGSVGAVSGESPEFLWFELAVAPIAPGAPVRIEEAGVATLTSPVTLPTCGARASFSVHEARVVIPRASLLAETFVDLRITGMDEGLRVEVDGRAVRYLARRDLDDAGGALVVPLFGQALAPGADGGHVVRLLHLDDCGATRPLVMQLMARGLLDAGDGLRRGRRRRHRGRRRRSALDDGAPTGGCGCQSDDRGGLAGLGLLGLMLALRPRRRRRR